MTPQTLHPGRCTGWAVRLQVVFLAVGVLAFGSDSTAPAQAGSEPAQSFSKFEFIGNWNIFDPGRVGRRDSESRQTVETISLVGTLQYEKGLFALFNSKDSAYRKTLREGESVGPFTVTHIETNTVELASNAKHITLAVGQQLRRPEGSDWTVGGTAFISGAAAPNTDGSAPADSSDVLKRLMEKRQKELKQ